MDKEIQKYLKTSPTLSSLPGLNQRVLQAWPNLPEDKKKELITFLENEEMEYKEMLIKQNKTEYEIMTILNEKMKSLLTTSKLINLDAKETADRYNDATEAENILKSLATT